MRIPYQDLIEEEIERVLKPLGSNYVQVDDGTKFLLRDLEMKQGTVVLKGSDTPLDSDAGRAWLRANKPHLLPVESDADEVAAAFTGKPNMTLRQALVVKVGLDEANRQAQRFALRSIFDTREGKSPTHDADKGKPAGNPWLDDSPRGEARRIAFIKNVGARAAASMAASAGRDIAGRKLRA